MDSVRTTCPYCGVGCGVTVLQEGDDAWRVRGDADHPANAGRLCSKGAALAATLGTGDRLLRPRIDGEEVAWDEALDTIAARFAATIAEHGRESVALYASGQLLTEDYYAANKFVKGWLGTANIDTNSRLCMASSVAGHKRAFGTDTVPGQYADLEQADLVILVGSNLAWCHPVLHQRLLAAREARPGLRILVIDPRATATTAMADRHLALAPDSDADLFGGLLADLARHDALDDDWMAAHVGGAKAALAAVAPLSHAETVRRTGLSSEEVGWLFEAFRDTGRVVTVYSQGVNQGVRGTDTVNAIINCHLATNRIGRPGTGPFSITGQPNAMGGREVGGLSNMLAAHTELDDAGARERVQRFWGSPHIASRPGPKAVKLFERIADGRIRAVWILATNPVDSLPDADRVREALRACPFVVVSDVVPDTDTARLAHVLLPSAAWGEKDGTVTNSERRISRQRGFRAPAGEARPDWWQIAAVAQRLGARDGFGWRGPADLFREHAALSAAAGSPDFDIGAAATLSDAAYEALRPFTWPWRRGSDQGLDQGGNTGRDAGGGVAGPGGHRFFGDGRFHTADGRARMIPIVPVSAAPAPPDDRPFVLNTGRVRDQWHTMTRTGTVPGLSSHLGEPFVEIAPGDAERLGIGAADIVEVASARGCVQARALVTDRQREGSLFMPMHWSETFASRARVDTLVSPVLDPVSGQPASKSERVSLTRWPARAFGYVLLSERPVRLPSRRDHYWALVPVPGGWQLELAGLEGTSALEATCRRLLEAGEQVSDDPEAERARWPRQSDPAHGDSRRLLVRDGRLRGAAFVASGPVNVARRWLIDRLGSPLHAGTDGSKGGDADGGTNADRMALLAGRPGTAVRAPGAIVCSCHSVGANTIRDAIGSGRCRSVAELGETLQAGTNCGACRPELATLLRIGRPVPASA